MKPLMLTGKLTRRWNVICARCTEWDMPTGSRQSAETTLRENGWRKIGSRWICRACDLRGTTKNDLCND